MARTFDTLASGGSFYEGPRWHEGRWYVSDFYRHQVLSIDEHGSQEVVAEVPGQPSGLGWLPDGSLLIVSMLDHLLLRRDPSGPLSTFAQLGSLSSGPLNDMVVDGAGRAWVGDFGFDLLGGGDFARTSLKRVDATGAVTVAASDLRFPNGAVVTADGRTLVVGESFGARYTAFTIGDDGTLTDRRVWADLRDDGVSPDGCCLDAEGRIWSADAVGRRFVLVGEGRGVIDEIPAPDGLGSYACMLGGGDGRTLLLCLSPDFEAAAAGGSHDAVLMTTTVEVPGAGWP